MKLKMSQRKRSSDTYLRSVVDLMFSLCIMYNVMDLIFSWWQIVQIPFHTKLCRDGGVEGLQRFKR